MIISKKDARKVYVRLHGLGEKPSLNGKAGVRELFQRISCLQYDPLDVVGKNADLVLQSRIKNYRKEMLTELLYDERFLVDGWDKMMAIYPTEYWAHYRRIRNSKDNGIKNVLAYRDSEEALDIVDEVMESVRTLGPISSQALEVGAKKKHIWGHRKMSSATLDYLFHIGRLGIHHKRNTQRVYDLIENLIPQEVLATSDPFENDEEFLDWYVKRRIKTLGFIWQKNTSGWLGYFIAKAKLRQKSIQRLLASGDIIRFNIEGIDSDFYILKEDEPILHQSINLKATMSFIAPLDHFIWDRDMVEAIFGFKYRWEVYTPLAKREFGYYVLPILFGDQLIGRIEFEKYRGEDTLIIKSIWLEENVKITKKLMKNLHQALSYFIKYLGAKDYMLPKGWHDMSQN